MSTAELEEELYPAITAVIQKDYPGSLVTHFTTIITVVSDDGTEMILTLDRPDQPLWQSMGMMDFVREMRRAMIQSQVHEQDDD